MPNSRQKQLTSIAGLVLAAVVAYWVLASWRPPRPVARAASAEEFSAERAFAHVLELAREPRPLGSPAHDRARELLVEELRALGLEPRVQEAAVVMRRDVDLFLAVKVRNVLARLAGSDSTGAVLLMSHYDSRPNTPGAGDALAGVAAILETVRALGAGPPLRNDVIVLLTDAEELGLAGARAFVDEHPWAADVRLVLNLEGRGNSGPALMFETREGNLDAVRGLRAATSRPAASSLSYEVYRRMPNDTDFTVFREAGVQGLNVAFLGGHPAYHTMLDSADRLDRGTLQHHGDYALGVARHFGGADLSAFGSTGASDAVYFNPWPWWLIVYPASWALPLAVAAVLALAVAIGLGRWRRRLELAGLGRGLALFGATLIAGALVGWIFWWLIANYLPGMLFGPHRLTYEAGWLVVALAAWIVAAAAALGAWLGADRSWLELSAGGWLGWAIASVALALWLPGASYLTTWPLVGGVLGLLILAVAARDGVADRAAPLVVAVAALPAVVVLAPTILTVSQALTLAAAAAIGAAIGLLLAPLAPGLGRLHRASGGRFTTLVLLAGLALVAGVAIRAEPAAETPAEDTLAYALDGATGEAWWASFDAAPDDWTSRYLGTEPERKQAPAALALDDREVLLAAAEPVELAGPAAATVADSRAAGRRVEAIVKSTRGAAVLRIRAEAAIPLEAVSVAGERFEISGDPEAEGLGEVRVTAFGFGAEGVTLGFEMAEPWPVELDLVDMSWGFDALPQPPPPRPPELIPSSSWRTDAVSVRGSALL